MKIKYIKIVATVLVLVSVLVLPCSALSFGSTYSDVVQSSTQSNNLIAFALNYDSFLRSDYVVFCPNQYQYYIVWGDLSASSDMVTSSGAVEYISYIRGSDYNSSYVYNYGTSNTFSLNSTNVCTSNIKSFGMKSEFYNNFSDSFNFKNFFIILLAFVFILLLFNVRRY